MKNLKMATSTLAGILAFGACAAGASADTSPATTTVDNAQAAAPAPATLTVTTGDPATSQHPVEGVTATYRGQVVPAGGVAISSTDIAYDGGSTILSLPSQAGSFSTRSLGDCGNYLCLWDMENFNNNGRMLRFRDSGCQNLGDFGFNDKMTSWANNLDRWARLRKDANCKGDYISAHSGGDRSANVGSGWNDEVSSIGIS